jgi:hypothetical protein
MSAHAKDENVNQHQVLLQTHVAELGVSHQRGAVQSLMGAMSQGTCHLSFARTIRRVARAE